MDELFRQILEMCEHIKVQLVLQSEILQALIAALRAEETPGDEEGPQEELGTWLLDDEHAWRVERAILEEQRVRGKAYYGGKGL